ncbi:hypothetical protein NMY22_g10197 [Coprinellus aureogranulatus]|nr:hypothetical protein NMY22_g10197 [Coprinellus aureogranulatus]
MTTPRGRRDFAFSLTKEGAAIPLTVLAHMSKTSTNTALRARRLPLSRTVGENFISIERMLTEFPFKLISRCMVGSIDGLWELYGAISISNCTTEVITIVLHHLDISLLPQHHTPKPERQERIERAFTCMTLLHKVMAMVLVDRSRGGLRDNATAFLSNNLDVDSLCLWIDLCIRLGLSLAVKRAPCPTPDTACTHFAYLLDDLLNLSPPLHEAFVSSSTFMDLLLRMWMARDNHGNVYCEFQRGEGPGCTVIVLMHRATDSAVGCPVLLQQLGSFPTKAWREFVLVAVERVRHCGKAIQKAFSPEWVVEVFDQLLSIMQRLSSCSDLLHRRFVEAAYLSKISSAYLSMHPFLRPDSAYSQDRIHPIGVFLDMALYDEELTAKNIRDLASGGAIQLCISVITSARSSSAAEEATFRSVMSLLCIHLSHRPVVENYRAYIPQDIKSVRSLSFENCLHFWLPELCKDLTWWLETLNEVYAGRARRIFICDNPLCNWTVSQAERSPRTCSGCTSVIYCSEECQRVDWRGRHKHECAAAHDYFRGRNVARMPRYSHQSRAFHLALVEDLYNQRCETMRRSGMPMEHRIPGMDALIPILDFMGSWPVSAQIGGGPNAAEVWKGMAFEQQYLESRYRSLIEEEVRSGRAPVAQGLVQARIPLGMEAHVIHTVRMRRKSGPGGWFTADYSIAMQRRRKDYAFSLSNEGAAIPVTLLAHMAKPRYTGEAALRGRKHAIPPTVGDSLFPGRMITQNPQLIQKCMEGSIEGLWEICGSISASNLSLDVFKIASQYLDRSLLPGRHTPPAERQERVDQAFTSMCLLHKALAIALSLKPEGGIRADIVAFLSDSLGVDGLCLWIDICIRLKLSLSIVQDPYPTPDTACTHFSRLLTLLLHLCPLLRAMLLESPVFLDLLLRMWMARDDQGRVYFEFDFGDNQDCPVIELMRLSTGLEECSSALLHRLAVFPKKATTVFALATIERVQHCPDGLQQGRPPSKVIDVLNVLIRFIYRQVTRSTAVHRAFVEAAYLSELTIALISMYTTLLKLGPDSPDIPQLFESISSLLRLSVRHEERVSKDIRELVSRGLLSLCISMMHSVRRRESRLEEEDNFRMAIEVLAGQLSYYSVVEGYQEHSQRDMNILHSIYSDSRCDPCLKERASNFHWWLWTLNDARSACTAPGDNVVCDYPSCYSNNIRIRGSARQCSGCESFTYCSEHCQRADWKEKHKDECRSAREYSRIRHSDPHIPRYSHRSRAFHVALLVTMYNEEWRNRCGKGVPMERTQADEGMAVVIPSFDFFAQWPPAGLIIRRSPDSARSWETLGSEQHYLEPRYRALIDEDVRSGRAMKNPGLLQGRFPLGMENYVVVTTRLRETGDPEAPFTADYSIFEALSYGLHPVLSPTLNYKTKSIAPHGASEPLRSLIHSITPT